MHRCDLRAALRTSICVVAAAWLLGGCSLLMPPREPASPAAVAGARGAGSAAPRLAALDTRHFELARGPRADRRDAGHLRALREHVLGDRAPVQPRLRGDAQRESRRRSVVAGRGHADLSADADDPARRAARGHRRQRAGHAALLLHDARSPRRPAGPRSSRSRAIRSASAWKAGRRRSAKRRSPARHAIPSGTCRRRFARSTPSAAIRCRASCRPGPTIRSARTR